ncbi:MAG: hypothetical protein M0Q13_02170 [Methanothrix sp.]|jgi:hypothetical protein|nr:hypothetical protein [Methanothrix sp.]
MIRKPCLYDIENLLIPAIIFILLTTPSVIALSTTEAEYSVLIKSITTIEDPRMDVNDLAFFLVTHDFDAVPKRDHVEVRIDDTVYKLVPNGQYPGLANVTVISR